VESGRCANRGGDGADQRGARVTGGVVLKDAKKKIDRVKCRPSGIGAFHWQLVAMRVEHYDVVPPKYIFSVGRTGMHLPEQL
jgi:hypothetical protein